MITREDIQATCDDIVREFAPLQVILFGSYAYGTPTEDSDVDLLVVMDTPEAETRRCDTEIRRRIPSRFPITRTHDLGKLLDLITPTLPDWHTWRSDVSKLSKYAVITRYPGGSATLKDTEQAMQICAKVRQVIRSELKLPQNQTEEQD